MNQQLEQPGSFRENTACPLCGSSSAISRPPSPRNLYSEKIAQQLNCSETELLNAIANRECTHCSLWYKSHALPAPLLERVFREVVPDHPKGWDAGSPRFSAQGFELAIEAFGAALASGTPADLARARRELSSIIDSLVELDGSPLRTDLLEAVESGDLASLASAKAGLRGLRWEPWPFKRFGGFGDPSMWQWFESRLGDIRRYAEVGCPRWGFLRRQPPGTREYLRLKRPEPNYWSEGCCREGRGCGDELGGRQTVQIVDWKHADAINCDLIGAFQYLDHVAVPMDFLREAFARSRALALVLDAVDQPTAVQHFSGWNLRSLGVAAEMLGVRLEHGFAPIRSSGNEVYLLHRESA